MVSLGKVTVNLVNGGPLSPYFKGGRGSVADLDFLYPKNVLSHVPMTGCEENILGEMVPP